MDLSPPDIPIKQVLPAQVNCSREKVNKTDEWYSFYELPSFQVSPPADLLYDDTHVVIQVGTIKYPAVTS